MNILIPNSWLKDYLETNATPQQFADAMSLTSVSIERINEVDGDFIYDIEITTNRPDLMSVEGIAQEASAVLPQAGFKAIFKPYKEQAKLKVTKSSPLITIKNDPELVYRITAVVLEVDIKPSPQKISGRLEKTDIRSLNNVIDTTNYIMRELGHPVHAFDYDKLTNHTLIIRRSKKGEEIETLDGKTHILPGNDIIAEDGSGNIVDLLGVMGLKNSSITDGTKRVLLFIDNNNCNLLRKTSMNLGIRTEAAVLNEKGVDPQKALPTLKRGIELLEEIANAKVVSEIVDIYPNPIKEKSVTVTVEKIQTVIGVKIPEKDIVQILTRLGFKVTAKNGTLSVTVPTSRIDDIDIPEDIVEEVARVYGYHKIPNVLPPATTQAYYHQVEDEYYWIKKVKEALKYWGFNETYTYSMVSEELYQGPIENAVKIKNPLDADHEYMRNSLVPSLIAVGNEHKAAEKVSIFELANVYINKEDSLPDERLHLAILKRGKDVSFYEGKGIVEQLFKVRGIADCEFEKKDDGIMGTLVTLNGKSVGLIELDEDELTVELDFSTIISLIDSKKKYMQVSKYPPVIEDLRIEVSPKITYRQIVEAIRETDTMIHSVELLDVFESKKTFRITFLSYSKNLTNELVTPIREKIIQGLEKKFKAKIG